MPLPMWHTKCRTTSGPEYSSDVGPVSRTETTPRRWAAPRRRSGARQEMGVRQRAGLILASA